MHTGMLWFDNSKDELTTKIKKAMDYYHKKYGRVPDLCLVHPAVVPTDPAEVKDLRNLEVKSNIAIRAYRPVLPSHIWIGIEDKE